jgi:hypothetical protein
MSLFRGEDFIHKCRQPSNRNCTVQQQTSRRDTSSDFEGVWTMLLAKQTGNTPDIATGKNARGGESLSFEVSFVSSVGLSSVESVEAGA